jgi:acyl CoA:acetate/3-ketoacid CoA transferase alpha subunit
LTTISNEYGRGDLTGDIDWGIGILLQKKQVKKIMLSYFGINKRLEHLYLNG